MGTVGTPRLNCRGTPAERLERRSVLVPWSGCRIWLGAINPDTGYGVIGVGRKTPATHRVAWESVHGPIPLGMHVCHHCDVRPCINVTHLFLGTHADNMRDCWSKDRDAHGERHGNAVLTAVQVAAIRLDPRTSPHVAIDYGIASSTVRRIRRRVDWART